MQSPYSFIVTPLNERRYDNIKNISGIDFFTTMFLNFITT